MLHISPGMDHKIPTAVAVLLAFAALFYVVGTSVALVPSLVLTVLLTGVVYAIATDVHHGAFG